MNYRYPRLSLRQYQIAFALFLLSLLLLSAPTVAAQPGDRRTPEQIRKDLQDKIADIEDQMARQPDQHYMHEVHGRALTDLIRYTPDRLEREALTEQAFADFDQYEKLSKGSAVEARALLHERLWYAEAPDPWRDELTAYVIEIFRLNPHFEATVNSYLELIHIQEQLEGGARSENLLRDYYRKVAYLYLYRAELPLHKLDNVKNMYDPRVIWQDCDKAIEYQKKFATGGHDIFFVTDIYMREAHHAFDLAEYEIALEACQGADDFLAEAFEPYCESSGRSTCESLLQSHREWESLLRGKAYLKTGNYEKAISNLNYYLTKGPLYGDCGQIYLMRAQAHSKLGNRVLALADQQKASGMSAGSRCREEQPENREP